MFRDRTFNVGGASERLQKNRQEFIQHKVPNKMQLFHSFWKTISRKQIRKFFFKSKRGFGPKFGSG